MIGLIRLILRYVWLGIFILGVRKGMELMQNGADDLIERIEDGDDSGLSRTIVRLHEALHRRKGRQSGGTDAFGEL
jgi:hypothetical protein